MRASWPGLLVAPLLALADQGVAYAMVEWSCRTQQAAVGHFVHLAFLVLTLATAWMAWREWAPRPLPGDAGDARSRTSFLAMMAVATAALSALVIAAMWLPQWFLSPCYA